MPSNTPASSPEWPTPREFVAILVKLREFTGLWCRQYGTGRWRCPADIEDKVQQTAVDCYLGRKVPDRWVPWARRVFENAVRKGPKRSEQSCDLELHHASTKPAQDDDAPEWHEIFAAWEVEFAKIFPALLERLSDQEKRALEGILQARSMLDAAERAGMTSRDLRSRFRRIVCKAVGVHARIGG